MYDDSCSTLRNILMSASCCDFSVSFIDYYHSRTFSVFFGWWSCRQQYHAAWWRVLKQNKKAEERTAAKCWGSNDETLITLKIICGVEEMGRDKLAQRQFRRTKVKSHTKKYTFMYMMTMRPSIYDVVFMRWLWALQIVPLRVHITSRLLLFYIQMISIRCEDITWGNFNNKAMLSLKKQKFTSIH